MSAMEKLAAGALFAIAFAIFVFATIDYQNKSLECAQQRGVLVRAVLGYVCVGRT